LPEANVDADHRKITKESGPDIQKVRVPDPDQIIDEEYADSEHSDDSVHPPGWESFIEFGVIPV